MGKVNATVVCYQCGAAVPGYLTAPLGGVLCENCRRQRQILRDNRPVPESMEPGVWFLIRALTVVLVAAGVLSIFAGFAIASEYKSFVAGGWIGLVVGMGSLVWFTAAGMLALIRRLVLLVQKISDRNATVFGPINPAAPKPPPRRIVDNSPR